jgi:hypothetical protein
VLLELNAAVPLLLRRPADASCVHGDQAGVDPAPDVAHTEAVLPSEGAAASPALREAALAASDSAPGGHLPKAGASSGSTLPRGGSA